MFLIRNLVIQDQLSLDPRGFNVYPINPPNIEEKRRPFLWRFWAKTPAKGRIAVFDKSWYERVLVIKINKMVKKSMLIKTYAEIKSFEQKLVKDGTVIIKFFLHIDRKEQKKRFKKLKKNPSTRWKVTKNDWKHHKQYKKYYSVIEEMLVKTDTEHAPWTIIEAHDKNFAAIKIFKTTIDAIERKVFNKNSKVKAKERFVESTINLDKLSSSTLDRVDLSVSLSRKEYKEELKEYQTRIRELEHKVFLEKIPVIIVYEGWDAAGKGGNIKRLARAMDTRGYQVIPIAAPNDIELAHHYLWRFWQKIPKAGHIAIFDRSWYGRVLVERVEELCTEEEWNRAFHEINEMEEHFVNFDTVLIKFWLHIDQEEQLKRFQAREKTPHKR